MSVAGTQQNPPCTHLSSQSKSGSQDPYPAFMDIHKFLPDPSVWGTSSTTPAHHSPLPCSHCYFLFPTLGNKHTSILNVTTTQQGNSCAARAAWLQAFIAFIHKFCLQPSSRGRLLRSRMKEVMKSTGFKAISLIIRLSLRLLLHQIF